MAYGHWGGYGDWAPYVPVAERRRKAARAVEQLRKKQPDLAPVTIEGTRIASSFWGKAWCQTIESYRDYEYRLERGRSYVRNGAVIDLKIAPGEVAALVSGAELYRTKITVAPTPPAKWRAICADCTGRIESLVELLQGRFSKPVMERLCSQDSGLFPRPAEIKFTCSCPDHAAMCKHVAAVLYGIGARLDRSPELLFRLRAVDETALLADLGAALPGARKGPGAGRTLAGDDLGALFGLDMAAGEADGDAAPPAEAAVRPVGRKAVAKRPAAKPGSARTVTTPTKLGRKLATRTTPARLHPGQSAETKTTPARSGPTAETKTAAARLKPGRTTRPQTTPAAAKPGQSADTKTTAAEFEVRPGRRDHGRAAAGAVRADGRDQDRTGAAETWPGDPDREHAGGGEARPKDRDQDRAGACRRRTEADRPGARQCNGKAGGSAETNRCRPRRARPTHASAARRGAGPSATRPGPGGPSDAGTGHRGAGQGRGRKRETALVPCGTDAAARSRPACSTLPRSPAAAEQAHQRNRRTLRHSGYRDRRAGRLPACPWLAPGARRPATRRTAGRTRGAPGLRRTTSASPGRLRPGGSPARQPVRNHLAAAPRSKNLPQMQQGDARRCTPMAPC